VSVRWYAKEVEGREEGRRTIAPPAGPAGNSLIFPSVAFRQACSAEASPPVDPTAPRGPNARGPMANCHGGERSVRKTREKGEDRTHFLLTCIS
jgi:hypothetical protein